MKILIQDVAKKDLEVFVATLVEMKGAADGLDTLEVFAAAFAVANTIMIVPM